MEKVIEYALDIDDVLADFYAGMTRLCGRPEKHCNIWDNAVENHWVSEIMIVGGLDDKPEFWFNLKPLVNPNAINFKVSAYITSSPEPMLGIRKAWLKFHGFPEAPVLHCKDKAVTMKKLGIDVLIDDSIKTVRAINEVEGLGAIQFVPSYMSEVGSDPHIKHLSQVVEVTKLLNL